MNKVLFSSEREDWATPKDFFASLDQFYKFDLDVCANELNRCCFRYYSKEQDGLRMPWISHNAVWCNPPYGRKVGLWLEKGAEEIQKGNCSTIVYLLPARTDTKWFHELVLYRCEIEFLRGRLKFSGSKNPCPFPLMLCIMKSYKEGC